VYVVGDFCFKQKDSERYQMHEILRRLNGTKVLIIGNHDYKKNHMYHCGFDVVLRYATVELGRNMRCFVSHKPYKVTKLWKWFTSKFWGWKHKDYHTRPNYRNMIQIHGHTHSPEKISPTGICVCVEAWDYRPANASEIVQLIQQNGLENPPSQFKRYWYDLKHILKCTFRRKNETKFKES
jgi:calcineurin-like phosphoesterase family protein